MPGSDSESCRAFVKTDGDSSKVIVIYTRVVILLEEAEFDTAQERCRILADRCRSEYQAELLCYIGESVFCEQLADTYSSLLTYSKDDVLQQNRITCVNRQSLGEKKEIAVPDTWGELLYTKEPQRLVKEVEKFLVPLARLGHLSEQNFRIFQQDMLQLFLHIWKKRKCGPMSFTIIMRYTASIRLQSCPLTECAGGCPNARNILQDRTA